MSSERILEYILKALAHRISLPTYPSHQILSNDFPDQSSTGPPSYYKKESKEHKMAGLMQASTHTSSAAFQGPYDQAVTTTTASPQPWHFQQDVTVCCQLPLHHCKRPHTSCNVTAPSSVSSHSCNRH
ncbi:hypothetical protein HJG60_010218 [Phyllostomus discolor]|uniref:Uncharacterized protein n=1 Tax=Phyllostomus discolor TaxID=89673 RepID=A0A834ASD9_9CHIR|nr:hypothetical protein HJG60_010218 [Phyllostomus discolor]